VAVQIVRDRLVPVDAKLAEKVDKARKSGDRLTDLMADAPDMFRAWGQKVLDHVKAGG